MKYAVTILITFLLVFLFQEVRIWKLSRRLNNEFKNQENNLLNQISYLEHEKTQLKIKNNHNEAVIDSLTKEKESIKSKIQINKTKFDEKIHNVANIDNDSLTIFLTGYMFEEN